MSPEAREPYETLAGAYDGLTTDVDYAAVLQFFETVLQRAGHSPKTVLDPAAPAPCPCCWRSAAIASSVRIFPRKC